MKKKYRYILVGLLVLLGVSIIVIPVLAGMVWEHQWDAQTVQFDLGYFAENKLVSYGWDRWTAPELNQLWYRQWNCPLAYGERVWCFAYSPTSEKAGYLRCKGGCARMTPTHAPTMEP